MTAWLTGMDVRRHPVTCPTGLCETFCLSRLCSWCLLSPPVSQSLSDPSGPLFTLFRITMCRICRICRRPAGLKLIDTHDLCCAMVEGPEGPGGAVQCMHARARSHGRAGGTHH